MTTQMPPVSFRVEEPEILPDEEAYAYCIAAMRIEQGYVCPYCGTGALDLEFFGILTLQLNRRQIAVCDVGLCRECGLLVYSPCTNNHVWSGDAYGQIDVIGFAQFKEG